MSADTAGSKDELVLRLLLVALITSKNNRPSLTILKAKYDKQAIMARLLM